MLVKSRRSRQYRVVPVNEQAEWNCALTCYFFLHEAGSRETERGWFKTGGTTEITDNFVPVDVKFVGFMIFGGH
jgi:hypothetical protein